MIMAIVSKSIAESIRADVADSDSAARPRESVAESIREICRDIRIIRSVNRRNISRDLGPAQAQTLSRSQTARNPEG